MAKVLILGAKGMLGSDLVCQFQKDYEVSALGKEDLDITDEVAVWQKISLLKPDIIINAAAYTAVDDAETNRDLAMKINGYAVDYLAGISEKIGAIFVHYSTDYVFDGKNPAGYKENESTEPINVYGESKELGEQLLLLRACRSLFICPAFTNCLKAKLSGCGESAADRKSASLKYYLVRTSWLYGFDKLTTGGKNRKNFVDTMLKLAKTNKELRVVNDQYGKPTYTVDLAKRTKELIEKKLPFGIYHITNETPQQGISWYDFALKIFAIYQKLESKFKAPKVIPVTSAEFPRPAKRPTYSMLINTKLPPSRNWEEALEKYLVSGI